MRTFVQVKIGRVMENLRTSEDRESDGEHFRVCEHLGSACYYISIYYYNIILYSSKYMNEFTFCFIDPQQIAMHIPSVFIA